ncbi:hypothetical protein ACFY0R_39750 [Streptomyces sp. NPDC001633]|uniref:hypothetical protein n=1 Tax=Streptomyces sp. NPDC001633 TaxID=3364595 RepID=UPI0036B74D22
MSGENSKEVTEEEKVGSPEGIAAAAEAASEKDENTESSSVVMKVIERFGRGALNIAGGVLHKVGTGHQTDEEIRRVLVERQLNEFQNRRETAREELDEVYKRLTKMETRGAEDGWTQAEKEEVASLRAERKTRERALKDLLKQAFAPIQPTREQIKRARGTSSVKRVVVAVVMAVASVAVIAAVPRLLLLVLPIAVAVLLWKGGEPQPDLTQRAVPERLLRPELELPGPGEDPQQDAELAEPYPISEADTPERAADCVQRALLAEGVKVRSVYPARRTGWGWQATAVLRSGTSDDVVRVLRRLDTDFGVGEGRTMAAGNPDASAEVVIRIMTSDPFANPPAYPVRAPKSCSIRQPWSPGISLDGEDTPLILNGLHTIVVADTGGGKSSLVRALADYVTACTDAVAIDIDPSGRGLGPLRHAAYKSAHSPDDAEKALQWLVEVAESRIAALDDLNDNFPVSDVDPAIIGIVDEYPKLTKKGRKAALDLLRIGRKARVTLVICTQDATEDIMGDAVADAFQIRILMPCRMADVSVVLGRPKAISEGWLPHMLVPGDEENPADAGRFYLFSARHRAPILRYVIPLAPEIALERAKERVSAGLPTLGTAALEKTSADLPTGGIAGLLMEAFEAAGLPEALPNGTLLDHLATAAPAAWGQWESSHERWADSPTDRLREGGKAIGRALRKEGLELSSRRLDELAGRPTGYRLDDLRTALEGSAH